VRSSREVREVRGKGGGGESERDMSPNDFGSIKLNTNDVIHLTPDLIQDLMKKEIRGVGRSAGVLRSPETILK